MKFKEILQRLIVRYHHRGIKDVEIEGSDERGYRFILTERNPIVLKLGEDKIVLRRGNSLVTSYTNTTKKIILKSLRTCINTKSEGLQFEINYGGGASEEVFIPKKYFNKLKNELEN